MSEKIHNEKSKSTTDIKDQLAQIMKCLKLGQSNGMNEVAATKSDKSVKFADGEVEDDLSDSQPQRQQRSARWSRDDMDNGGISRGFGRGGRGNWGGRQRSASSQGSYGSNTGQNLRPGGFNNSALDYNSYNAFYNGMQPQQGTPNNVPQQNFPAYNSQQTYGSNNFAQNRQSSCPNCGGFHARGQCYAWGHTCTLCHKLHHLAAFCRSRPMQPGGQY